MPDLNKVQNIKERIISTIRTLGPSYPGRVARETGINPLFTAALLSELVADKRLVLSAMRVGSSPLYLIPGQEEGLQQFVQHLNHKEREAFEMLKTQQVLDDSLQEPAIRVALRKIKDFAIPVNVRQDGEEKTFWKFYLIPDNAMREKIEEALGVKKERPVKRQEERKEEIREIPIAKKEEEIVERPKKKEKEETEEKPEPVAKVKKVIKKDFEFADQIKEYLAEKNIELLTEIENKKKEFTAKVRIDTALGKQEFYLIAKDKKKITQDELIVAIQKAQGEKMPALIIAPGQIDKTAQEYLKDWRNLIKFEQIKF